MYVLRTVTKLRPIDVAPVWHFDSWEHAFTVSDFDSDIREKFSATLGIKAS